MGSATHESSAAIKDTDYSEFLERENLVLAAPTESEKSRRVAQSAEIIGTVKICPDCETLLFLMPMTFELVRYRKESEQEK